MIGNGKHELRSTKKKKTNKSNVRQPRHLTIDQLIGFLISN